ncbi:MAG: polysaccharide biosynthesis tyrosine autokinase, partial [Acidobacteriota bacterium]|nr:polysaccharide biosynthesis tyrosine autokinase [Acidobacteriota bacterium]
FPYKPSIFHNAGAGLIGGLVFGIGLVVLRERADRTIQSPGETAYYLNVPELGVIPAVASDRDNSYRRRELAAKFTDPKDQNGDRHLTDCVELVTLKRRPSMVAESFRAALASILFSESSVIVFSSSAPSEGKTTVLSNLGVAMAETHRRVLLIDADLRKPRLHHIFDVANARGLSDLLRSEKPLDDFRPEDLIQETGVNGLSILPSGPEAASISDLLYSARLPELLKHVRAKFDVVLIDTPPMLQMPDARILGRMADGVILIVRAGNTTRDTMLVATQRFVEDGTPVLGTILNNWNPKTRAADGYQGYYKGYQAYYGSNNGKDRASG